MHASRTVFPAALLGLGLAAPVRADLLEFLITVAGDATDNSLGSAHAAVVFDTDAPPIMSDENSVTFIGLGGWIEGVAAIPGFDGMGTDPTPVFARGPLTAAMLVYDERFGGSYTIDLESADSSLTMSVAGPSGFSTGIASLPEVLEGYRPGVLDGELTVLFRVGSGVVVSGSVFPLFGSGVGGAGFNVRFVNEIPAYACNPADIDRNGVLNLDDIDAFAAEFLGGCG